MMVKKVTMRPCRVYYSDAGLETGLMFTIPWRELGNIIQERLPSDDRLLGLRLTKSGVDVVHEKLLAPGTRGTEQVLKSFRKTRRQKNKPSKSWWSIIHAH